MTLLRRATELLEPADPRRLSLLPDLGQALYWLGRFDESYRALDEAIDFADPDTAAFAFFYKGHVQGHGESKSAYELEHAVRERLALVEESASDRTLAAGYLSLGWALYWLGRLTAGIEAARTRR